MFANLQNDKENAKFTAHSPTQIHTVQAQVFGYCQCITTDSYQ